ncbi:MAG: SCO family protein [Rhodomicrobium sp.]
MGAVFSTVAAILGAVLILSSGAGAAFCQAPRQIVSDIDPRLMYIDQNAVLGNKIDPGTALIDDKGREFRWEEMLGRPFIVVLSYFTCDGSCSIINQDLAKLLKGVTAVKAGEDFRILTVSFDRHDTLKTATAFREKLALPAKLAGAWTLATFKSEDELKKQTGRVGFKFFWSPQDKAFLHPGAYLFFSPEGRLSRVLYQQDADSSDVELAILDANKEHMRVTEIRNLVLSLCYSYNFKDGKYQLSILPFVALAGLPVALLMVFGPMVFYKMKKGRVMKGANHAKVA